MNENTLKQLVLFQFFALITNMAASISLSLYAAEYLQIQNAFLEIIAVLLISWVSFKILNIIGLFIICIVLYKGDANKLDADIRMLHGLKPTPEPQPEEKNEPKQLAFTVVSTADKPLGKYMDADFYEWIELKEENDSARIFDFDGTADMKTGASQLKAGQILIEPGIIYRLREN